MTLPTPEAPEDSAESPLYHISFQRLEELKRSPVAVMAARRGPSCPSLLQPEHELTDPQALIDEIAEYCQPEDGFIQPDMPIQEIIFRLLLCRRNQATALHDLHYELTEKWATPIRPINITATGLRRILDADTYYGIVRAGAGAD